VIGTIAEWIVKRQMVNACGDPPDTDSNMEGLITFLSLDFLRKRGSWEQLKICYPNAPREMDLSRSRGGL
jgi:hypothetical protein